MGESSSFQRYNSKLNLRPYLGCEKNAFGTSDYWRCCLQGYTTSIQHQVILIYKIDFKLFEKEDNILSAIGWYM